MRADIKNWWKIQSTGLYIELESAETEKKKDFGWNPFLAIHYSIISR